VGGGSRIPGCGGADGPEAGVPPAPLDVLSAIAAHARRNPARAAVSDERRELSYGQLLDEAARTAAGLRALGVGAGDRVALLLENGVGFVVAALGCMLAECVFTPIAVSDPERRRAAILADLEPALVLSEGEPAAGGCPAPSASLAEVLDRGGADGLATRLAREPVPSRSGSGGEVPCGGARVAYCVYTSGTTGAPKGVMVGREAFAFAVAEIARIVGVDERTRALCVSPVHFDGSFSVIFPTLYRGGLLHIPRREQLLFPRVYFATLRRRRINCVSFSPSFLRLLRAGGGLSPFAQTDVEVLALGGEAPTCEEVRRIWQAKPSIRVINRYGPTEATISVSDLVLTPELLDGGNVPIGAPHAGSGFHLVDADGRPVSEPGVSAELCVSGRQLMHGYWRAPELTAAALRDDLIPGRLVYRTGDLVRLDGRGLLEFVGRTDRLVKHRGVRVSLQEVAQRLNGLEGVRACAAVAFDDGGSLGIAAFVVAAAGAAPSASQLLAELHDLLPEAMHPDRLFLVPALPLGSSSKLDEARLLEQVGLTPWAEVAPGAPPIS